MVKALVVGYGTIGKRVADAINLQDDMKLLGVVKTSPDYKIKLALRCGYTLFVSKEHAERFEKAGIDFQPLEEGLEKADIIIDATPAGIGAKNKKMYEEYGKKTVFQGGEEADVAEVSFVAQVNYEKAIGKKYVRVVSCNTTGLARTLSSLCDMGKREGFEIEKTMVTLIRRAADPHESEKGPINAIVPKLKVPSHHGPDVKTVLDIPITTVAVKVPTTLSHLHVIAVKLNGNIPSKDDIVYWLAETPRTILVSKNDGIDSTASMIELARDLGRKRNDIYETVIWKDSITVSDSWLYLMQAVHQEAIVVPENIDAVRAVFNLMSKEESIKKTNETLGVVSNGLFE